jgi:NAD(P)-dependent dehydrogenase (short-subunit alcohol dehydrogenase family)
MSCHRSSRDLLDAVQASGAQVKDHHHRPAAVIVEPHRFVAPGGLPVVERELRYNFNGRASEEPCRPGESSPRRWTTFFRKDFFMSVLDRFRLDGKRLFITGGSRGLGREMALALAEAGADVVLAARDAESLDRTVQDIRRRGRQAFALCADVGQPETCQSACEQVLADHGPIDILINNVGGRRVNIPTAQMPLETWQEILNLNLTSTFLCTKIIGGAMVGRQRGGRIINVASMSGMIVNRGIGGRGYETSKAAVIQFTRATAADWATGGVTVNAICPGFFMTEPNLRWSREHPKLFEMYKEQIPAGEFGRAEDLGPLAVYLASEAARYVTGATFVIDGGYTLW